MTMAFTIRQCGEKPQVEKQVQTGAWEEFAEGLGLVIAPNDEDKISLGDLSQDTEKSDLVKDLDDFFAGVLGEMALNGDQSEPEIEPDHTLEKTSEPKYTDFKTNDYVISDEAVIGRITHHGLINGELAVQAYWISIFNQSVIGTGWSFVEDLDYATEDEILEMLEVILDTVEDEDALELA